MADELEDASELPSTAGRVAEAYPGVWNEYTDLGKACSAAGPIDDETKRLVKLALAVGSHTDCCSNLPVSADPGVGVIRK